MSQTLDDLLVEIAACRVCRDASGRKKPLPHEPRPVLRAASRARIAICGQAPGNRVHQSGKPFTDPSGDRLREWMGVDCDTFYDCSQIAIVPMGFCFPGLDAKGGDLPPRTECAPLWRKRVLECLPDLQLLLLVGSYAVKWHLAKEAKANLTDTVAVWREYENRNDPLLNKTLQTIPMPHPSWRNNTWLKRNPWFESELLPVMQAAIDRQLVEQKLSSE